MSNSFYQVHVRILSKHIYIEKTKWDRGYLIHP